MEDTDFLERVFAAEVEYLRERRRAVRLEEIDASRQRPDVRNGLVGLALSGGGIRSALFNLGVLQGLYKRGFFRRIDYLSTVSGGGFIGSSLSSLCAQEAGGFPFAESDGMDSPAVRYLRNNANYLLPRGLLNRVRGLVTLLRGMALNVLVLLPVVLVAVLVTVVAYGPDLREHDEWERLKTDLERRDVPFSELLEQLSGLPPQGSFPKQPIELVKKLETMGLVTEATPDAPESKIWESPGPERKRYMLLAEDLAAARYLYQKNAIIESEGGGDERFAPAPIRLEWSTNLLWFSFAWIVALPVVTLFWKSIYRRHYGLSSKLRSVYETSFSVLLVALVLVTLVELQPYLVYYFHQKTATIADWIYKAAAFSILAIPIAALVLSRLKQLGRFVLLTLVGVLSVALPFLLYLVLVEATVYGQQLGSSDVLLNRLVAFFFFVLVILLTVALTFLLDTNSSSLLDFYRERLSKALLVGRIGRGAGQAADGEAGLRAPSEDLKLSEMCAPGSAAPYHLLNATLNLHGSAVEGIERRRSDFFLFSPRFVGSRLTGYCTTRALDKVFPFADLGTAMAISGAALAPNMGVFGTRGMSILMSVLNIRLGYWLPNPARVRERIESKPDRSLWRRAVDRVRFHPWAYLLLREAFGTLDERGYHVNVSDGGHLENTGIYELLRRRCRYIVASDAEADPGGEFGGMVALLRYARLDLGVKIEIDLGELRPDGKGVCPRHWVVGRVIYPDAEEPGYLLYLKASITGDESEIVRGYRNSSPGFPHQSTADQFFDEAQFEAYRDLGEHVVGSVRSRADDTGAPELPEVLLAVAGGGGPAADGELPGAHRSG